MDATLRQLVRDRAAGRCEYRRLPEAVVEVRHVVDHVTARQHRGGDDPMNLAFACVTCNRHKGTNLAGVDPLTGLVTPLFDPRRDTWADHFAWAGYEVVGRTPTGRATVATLQFNGRLQLVIRRATQADWPPG